MTKILGSDDLQQMARALNIPELFAHIYTEWGSEHANHRNDIAKHIEQTLAELSGEVSRSTSHTEGAGGYIYLPGPLKIGFDIEVKSRLRPAVVRRISHSDEEVMRARNPENLWVAKEAVFKALRGPMQPAVISAIEVSEWTLHNVDLETFFIKNPEQFNLHMARGVVLSADKYAFSVFICQQR